MMHRQFGISLFLALIALAIMSLAAVALVRSVDSDTLVIGNLGFKQTALAATDRGVETAVTWLKAARSGNACGGTPSTYCNNENQGYYASAIANFDITGNSSQSNRIIVDWDNNGCSYAAESSYIGCIKPSAVATINGVEVRYVITRLCRLIGDPNGINNSCRQVSQSSSGSSKKGEIKYGEDKRFTGSNTPYYRVIVRARGARNTVSYTETTIGF